ncbi:hypothetical protein [Peribacillus acanthi]|uniref:hypothetical protein n=1 Tax=Peribacillus acanthi TaxID=2171554 RepID=UPI000D3E47CF|nr:hypothetical protein [Peribacillus acanthi]
MNWNEATKSQLLTIALHDNCPVDHKYRAVQELQMRWNQDMLLDLVRMYGQGKEVWEIAEYLGISESDVAASIKDYKLYRGRVKNESTKIV